MQVTKYQSEEQRGREDGENCTGKKNIHIGPEREKESGEEKTARNLDNLFDHLLLFIVNHVFYFGLKIKIREAVKNYLTDFFR